MLRRFRAPALLLALAMLLPTAAAEFGPVSEDGYPINIHGEVVYPPTEAVHVHAHDEGPLNKLGPVTAYPYYPLLTAELERLAEEHPDLVKLTSAGKSTAGLDLWLLEIADHARIEKGEGVPLEEREVVYIDGGTHSNEYSGVYFVTEIAQFLLDEYETNETAKWIVENRHTFILPMVNPDGSNAFGRLNANTVNINRNFPYTWGAVDEHPIVNNPGPEPASEPETQIVMEVMERIQPDYVNSIHCCGNLWLHPYGAEKLGDAPDVQMYTRICDEVFYDVRDDCGPIWSTIYPASGTTADEGYGLVGASSWTYEMSGRANKAGFWGEPVTEQDVRVQERESWRGVIHAFENVHKYGAYPELVALEGDGDRLVAVVENAGYGPLFNGTLTVGGVEVALPEVGAGNRTTVEIPGTFAAGELDVTLGYQKRILLSPMGERTLDLELTEQAGELVAHLADGTPLTAADVDVPDAGNTIPSPGAALAVLALAALARLGQRKH